MRVFVFFEWNREEAVLKNSTLAKQYVPVMIQGVSDVALLVVFLSGALASPPGGVQGFHFHLSPPAAHHQ